MNQQKGRTLQQTRTSMPAAEVIAAAKRFFTRHNSIYSAYLELEGPTHVTFRGQGGEEIAIGVAPTDGGSSVNGSTYLFDQQVARFLSTLPPLDQTAGGEAAVTAAAAPSGAGAAT